MVLTDLLVELGKSCLSLIGNIFVDSLLARALQPEKNYITGEASTQKQRKK